MVTKRSINKQKRSTKRSRQLYNENLHISVAKKADLLSLVTSVTIPKEYVKPAINHCSSSKTVKDKLSVPSVSDSDESDW